MKNTLLCCFILFCIPLAKGQNLKKINIKGNFNDRPLILVLLDLETDYRLKFEYDREIVKDINITARFGSSSVELGMKKILSGTNIDFEVLSIRSVALFTKVDRPENLPSVDVPTKNDFNVTGVVKDMHTGETLPFASVVVSGTGIGATTNVDGYFTLFEVPSDTALLEVSYLGYQEREYRLTPNSEINRVEILMEDFGIELEEVTIKANKQEQMLSAATGISRIGLAPAALANLPSYGEKDVFRSLQLLPGISGSNESSSGLYVRGGTPDQNLVLFDGFTVYHVDHLFGFFSAFNTSAIKDVQLYKGGFDAKYGGRLSSVVELTGKEGNTEELNIGFGASLLSVNGFVEAPFADGKGSVMIAGRRSFQSNFYNNIFNAFTESSESASDAPQRPDGGGRFGQEEVIPNTYFYDLNAKTTFRPNAKDVFSLSFYSGKDNLDNSRDTDQGAFGNRPVNQDISFDRQSADLTAWGNWGASAKWSRKWSDRFYSNVNLSYSNYFSERDRTNNLSVTRADTTIIRNTGSYENNDLRDVSLRLDNEFKISQNNQLDFGLHTTRNDIEYKFVQNDTTTVLNRDDEGQITAFYIQDRHTFGDKLILKGGLRTSHYSITEDLYLEPRASLTYLLTDKVKLKAAWGKYYQFANRIVREDIQQGSRDFWLLADDETVPISSAYHNIIGASYETNNWLFDVEAYYKPLDGLSEYSTRFTPTGRGRDRVLEYEEFFHTGTGTAKGIEFLAQRKVGKLTGWIGYTLGEVKYDFEAFGDEPFFANQDVTHEFKLVGNYKLGKISLGGTFVYATGKPYTAPTGYYQLDLLDGTSTDFFEISDKNDLRFEDYHRLDLSATYDFHFGANKASVGLSLSNLYGRKNTWYNEYEVIDGELLETNVSLLGFTPSVFFNWTLK